MCDMMDDQMHYNIKKQKKPKTAEQIRILREKDKEKRRQKRQAPYRQEGILNPAHQPSWNRPEFTQPRPPNEFSNFSASTSAGYQGFNVSRSDLFLTQSISAEKESHQDFENGRTPNQKLRRWIAKQGERDAISSEILKIRHQTASSSKFINDPPNNTPSDHQINSARTTDLRRLISTQNYSEHNRDDDVHHNHREQRNHVVSSMNETTDRFQPILRRPRPSFENDGNRPIGTAHRFQIVREVNPSSSSQSFDDVAAEPSGLYSTDGQMASSVRVLPIHNHNNSSNDDVYKSIKEIELEEYRRRKQMVNDLAKLCKTIPLTVKMVNPLINNFNGWPNNTVKN